MGDEYDGGRGKARIGINVTCYMSEEIKNRVSSSELLNFNLEDYYPEGERAFIDISQYLEQGIVLREKEFRKALKEENWEIYRGKFVAIDCSTDAIVPTWAFMLIVSHLDSLVKKAILGDLETLEKILFLDALSNIDLSKYKGKPVIVNGCGNKPVPDSAYLELTQVLKPVVKSLMFGEACSTVPIYKRK